MTENEVYSLRVREVYKADFTEFIVVAKSVTYPLYICAVACKFEVVTCIRFLEFREQQLSQALARKRDVAILYIVLCQYFKLGIKRVDIVARYGIKVRVFIAYYDLQGSGESTLEADIVNER